MTSNEPKVEIENTNLELDSEEIVESLVEDSTNEATESDADEIVEESSPEELLQGELESLAQKANENMELAQRTQADMDNLRKRTIRDIENAHKFALERFVNDLIPVIDSLELGIQASESVENADSLKEGMDLTLKMLTDTLEKFGVSVVNPQGEKFSPDKHEAISMAESEEFDAGVVMSVFQKGYELNGRLVRPAMVIVSK
ncbi:MAG: molecular chaperone GrpE [Gammaproteobacteria bacterium]|jgi:molecular chaperone GrpE